MRNKIFSESTFTVALLSNRFIVRRFIVASWSRKIKLGVLGTHRSTHFPCAYSYVTCCFERTFLERDGKDLWARRRKGDERSSETKREARRVPKERSEDLGGACTYTNRASRKSKYFVVMQELTTL